MACGIRLRRWHLAVSVIVVISTAAGSTFAQTKAKPVSASASQVSDFTLPEGQPAVEGELIVRFKELPEAGLMAAVPGTEAPVALSADTFVFKIERAEDGSDIHALTSDMVMSMTARDDVAFAEPNYYAFPMEVRPNDPEFPRMWHYQNRGTSNGTRGSVDLPRAWDVSTGSTSIVVAVLDTGILPNHPEFAGSPNLLDGFDMISSALVENDPDPGRDDDETDPGDAVAAGECPFPNPPRNSSWHGSHVAGTIGAGKTNDGNGIAGVAWQVGVLPVRVLGKCGGTTADIAAAIRWAAGISIPGIRANTTPADVINLSLGGRGACSASYRSAIADAIAAGATVVVAAGNESQDAAGFSPASCADAITVGAVDARGHIARYSNFGSDVDIMAPGGDVQRDDDNDGNLDGVLSVVDGGYAGYNGTSMAAPHVSGIIALWLASGSMSPAQVAARVTSQSHPLASTDGCGPGRCGAGLITAASPSGSPPGDGGVDDSGCGMLGGEAILFPIALVGLRRRKTRKARKDEVEPDCA